GHGGYAMKSLTRHKPSAQRSLAGRLGRLGAVVLLSAALLLAYRLWPAQAAAAEAHSQVKAAWQLARRAGGYDFSASVVQTTIPLPSLANLGRTSQQQVFQLEGSSDLRRQTLELALWQGGASPADRSTAVQVKVEGDQAFARRGDQAWEAVPDFT